MGWARDPLLTGPLEWSGARSRLEPRCVLSRTQWPGNVRSVGSVPPRGVSYSTTVIISAESNLCIVAQPLVRILSWVMQARPGGSLSLHPHLPGSGPCHGLSSPPSMLRTSYWVFYPQSCDLGPFWCQTVPRNVIIRHRQPWARTLGTTAPRAELSFFFLFIFMIYLQWNQPMNHQF